MIFQPEVAADAIVWASQHDRRELYVGAPTVLAIVGDKIAPAAGDFGARGHFDTRARPASRQLWLTQHRATLGAAALVVAGLIGIAGARRIF